MRCCRGKAKYENKIYDVIIKGGKVVNGKLHELYEKARVIKDKESTEYIQLRR